MNIYLKKDVNIGYNTITANGQSYGHAGATPGEVISKFGEKQFADLSGGGWDLHKQRLATANSIKGEYVSSVISGSDRAFQQNSPQYPDRMITDGTEIDIELSRNVTINSIIIYYGKDYLTDFTVQLIALGGTVRETININNNSDSVVAITPTTSLTSRKIKIIANKSHLPNQYFYLKGISVNGNILPIERVKEINCTHDLDLLSENLPIDDFAATFTNEAEIDTYAYSMVSSELGDYYIDTINTSDDKVYSLVAYSELSRLDTMSQSYEYPAGLSGGGGGTSGYINFANVINTAVGRTVIPSVNSIYYDQRFNLLSSGITNRELIQAVCQAATLQVTTSNGYISVGGCVFPAGTDITDSDVIGRVDVNKVKPYAAIVAKSNLYDSEGANEEKIHISTDPGRTVKLRLSKPYYSCTIETTGSVSNYQIDTAIYSRDFVIRDIRTSGPANQTWLTMTYLTEPQIDERVYIPTTASGTETLYLVNDDFYYGQYAPESEIKITDFYKKVCAIDREISAKIILRDRQVGQTVNITTASGDTIPILITHLDISGNNTLVADMKGVVWNV